MQIKMDRAIFDELKAGARRVFIDQGADKKAQCDQRTAGTEVAIGDTKCNLDDKGLVVFKKSSIAKKPRSKKA